VATLGEDVLMRWLAVPVVLASVTLLTACGSSKGPVAAAAAKSSKAQSMHILTLLQEQNIQGSTLQLTLDGDFNNVTKRSSLVLNLGGLARSLGDTGASSQLFNGQELTDGSTPSTVYYLNVPFYSQAIPKAKTWLKFNLAKLGYDQGIGLLEIAELNSTDPRGQLDVLQKTSTKFANLGQDEIDGELATHYQGQVDLDTVLSKLDGPSKAEIESLLRHSNGSAVPYNVWIADDGYIRRVEMQIAGTSGSQNTTLGLISDFSAYGKPVYVNLPPGNQVTELTDARMTDLTTALESK
jgi:hypothetical protein